MRSKIQWIARLLGLSLLIVGFSEALITLDQDRKEPAIGGYLVKSGPQYVVIWRTREDEQLRAYRFTELTDAVDQARRLKLHPGRFANAKTLRLQRLWMRKGSTGSEVHWKHSRSPYTHRLTFRHPADAKYFFEAFESGAYSQSPFGHSIQLVPSKFRP